MTRTLLRLFTLALLVVMISVAPALARDRSGEEGDGKVLRRWTVLVYATAFGTDQKYLLNGIADLKTHCVDGQGVEFVVLLDRGGGYAGPETGVGEHFQGTRLYRLRRGRAERLGGGTELPAIRTAGDAKLRMGDPATLRQFVRYGKAHHPAEHYALFLYGHGVGRCMCFDRGEGRDALFTAAITETLERKDSVNLLVLDVCFGAAMENLYQWLPGNGRFQADFLVAAPGAGRALPYGRIVERLRKPNGEQRDTDAGRPEGMDPAGMTARDFGDLVVAQADAHVREIGARGEDVDSEAWACCDLSKAKAVKQAVDALAVSLAETDGRKALEAVRGSGDKPVTMSYMPHKGGDENDWLYFPYFDLDDLARKIRASDSFPPAVRERAAEVLSATEALVVSSFGQSFRPGRSGVYVVLPDGAAGHKGPLHLQFFRWAAGHEGQRHWQFFRWYTPLDVRRLDKDSFGLYAWCQDGATAGNGRVENWFELLDAWYDTTNDETGGINGYQW